MSFPRLALLVLGLPLLTAACAAPVAVAGASYGADGVSLVDSGKTTSDHFASMVSKKDCALWRMFRNQRVCREREGDKDPYQVNYDLAERQPSEDGVAYAPPLRAASDAPAASWTAEAYKTAPAPAPVSEPTTVVAETASPPSPAPPAKTVVHKSVKKKTKAHAKAVKKPSPSQVASVP
jgi:hypothetical protein